MSIDWSRSYKGALRGNRGKFGSYAEMLQHQQAQQVQLQKAQTSYKKLEPLLKKSLMEHMLSRNPIRVVEPIEYFTETLQKSESGSAGFSIQKALIPAGSELTFSHIDKILSQWIFKSKDGREYEIYSSSHIQIPGGPGGSTLVPNPGYFGLLTKTHIYQNLAAATEENQ